MIEIYANSLFIIGEALSSIHLQLNMNPSQKQFSQMLSSQLVSLKTEISWFFVGRSLRTRMEDAASELGKAKDNYDEVLENSCIANKKQLTNSIMLINSQLIILGLNVSDVLLQRISDRFIETGDMPPAADILELTVRIRDELAYRKCLFINNVKSKYYEQKDLLFGQGVADSFSSAGYDIDEAGKCYALGRSTACVFHLMRVVEIALRALCAALDVELSPNANWLTILNTKLAPAIDRLPNNTKPERERRKDMQLIHTHLHAVRLALRNDTMHPKATYTDEEAGEVLRHVETFMKHLAERL